MPKQKPIKIAKLAEKTDWQSVAWRDIYSLYRSLVGSAAEQGGFMPRISIGEKQRELGIDVFRKITKKGAKNALVVISGTHGVEGPAGSFVQMMMANDSFFIKQKNTAIILIHALNPWGYSHGRRTNSENIDLNRNGGTEFITRSGYGDVHHLVMPEEWDDAAVKGIQNIFTKDPSSRGKFMSGQHDFSNGIFYGGKMRGHSFATMKYFSDFCLSGFEKISILDIHTGLGEFGKVTPISPAISFSDPFATRTNLLGFGSVVFPNIPKEEGVIGSVSGDILSALGELLPKTKVTPLALEFGTMPFMEYFTSFVGENWIHHNQNRLSLKKEKEVKEKFWELFYPREHRALWLEGIWEQTREIAKRMVLVMNET
jgi:hypothetical protein